MLSANNFFSYFLFRSFRNNSTRYTLTTFGKVISELIVFGLKILNPVSLCQITIGFIVKFLKHRKDKTIGAILSECAMNIKFLSGSFAGSHPKMFQPSLCRILGLTNINLVIYNIMNE